MAELTINPDDIAAALRKNLEGFKPDVETAQVGRIVEVGDGIARVSGLPGAAVNELLEFEGGIRRPGAQPRRGVDRRRRPRRGRRTSRRARRSRPPAASSRCRWATACSAGSSTPSASRSTARARSPTSDRRMEIQAPGITGRQPVHEPLQTGIKAIDAMTPIGPGPARADHRRPQDGQDHRRRRHDPQPARPRREVHLRRHRPEGLHRGPDGRHPRGARRHGLHGRGRRPGVRPGAVQVPRPLRRLRHGPALDGERRARPHRLRRPVQAGRGLPPDVAAAAPPAGPRGLPGRRVLPPQPAARAGGQAERRRTAPARSPPCRSSRPRPATSRPTSPPT